MNPGIPLRPDFDALTLRRLARSCIVAKQARRLLALAAVHDGESRARAAQIGGMDRQTLRDWVHRFNAEGPAGLIDHRAPGAARRLSDAQMAELPAIVEAGPDRARDGVVRWRRIDLKQIIRKRFGVTYAERSVGDLLKASGFSHVSGRPQAPGQNPRMLRLPRPDRRAEPSGARRHAGGGLVPGRSPLRSEEQRSLPVGPARQPPPPTQGSTLRERLSLRRHLPRARDWRGTGAALTLPSCDAHAMTLHLQEIALAVVPGAHALVALDRAPWHRSGGLKIPDNITLALLPPRSPELNPAENVWQFLRQTWLANRVFETYDDILYACCEAWNRLIERPCRIMTIGLRPWA